MKKKIAIVEDEGIVAMDIKKSLLAEGYDVPFVVDAAEKIISILEKNRVDVIIMDIVLNGKMNGIEAAIQIKRNYNIPVIFVTALNDEALKERSAQYYSYGYFVKPFDNDLLNEAIKKIF
jgi:CheY-like chemotaxis protein